MWVEYPYNRPLCDLARELETRFGCGLHVTHFGYRNIEVGLDQCLCHFHFDEHFPLCIIGVIHCANAEPIRIQFVEQHPVGVDVMERPLIGAQIRRNWPRQNCNLNV